MLQLQFVGLQKPPIWLVKNKISIGSANDCDIVLPASSAQALHAEIRVDDEGTYIFALHPVLANELAVTDHQALQHGMRITIGQIIFVIVDPKIERVAKESLPAVTAPQQWAMVSLTTALANKRFTLSDNDVIGRAKECEICLGISHLSRKHARFSVTAESLMIEDLGSANGTFVNGERIHKKRVRQGDEVRFDTLVFRIVAPGVNEDVLTDQDKTSLRPSIPSAAQSPAEAVAATPAKVGTHKQERFTRPQPVAESATSDSQPANAYLPWWLAAVAVITVIAVIYLIS